MWLQYKLGYFDVGHNELVAICDQFIFFRLCQLKSEGFREAIDISPDLLAKSFRLHSIQQGQIAVDHDLDASDGKDSLFDAETRYQDIVIQQFRTHAHPPSALRHGALMYKYCPAYFCNPWLQF